MREEVSLEREIQDGSEKLISTKIYFSSAFGVMLFNFLVFVFGTRVFDFYENEVGLNVGIIAFVFIIYAIWSIVNNPLIGYFVDKPRKFWSKYGKRFLWIIIGGLCWSLSFIFLFLIPDLDPIKDELFLTIWLLFILCIYSFLFSLYDVNYGSLIPDKFRTDEQRLRQSSFSIALGVIGTVLGAVIPPLIIVYGDKRSFVLMAIIISLIGVSLVLIQIPGIREDKTMIERALHINTQNESVSFIKMMKEALKHRNFVAYLCIFTSIISSVLLMTASMPYLVRFILNEDAIVESYLLLGFIVTGLISVPIWAKIAQKLGDFKKTIIIATLLTVFLTIPFYFVNNLLFAIVSIALIGVGLVGISVMLLPIFGDILDEATVRNGTKQEGFYVGFRTIFARISIIVQAVTFALIHLLMGFEPGSTTQSPRAILGLRIQVSIIPIILLLIGLAIFWRFYDLTPEKKEGIKKQLKELDL